MIACNKLEAKTAFKTFVTLDKDISRTFIASFGCY